MNETCDRDKHKSLLMYLRGSLSHPIVFAMT